MPCGDTKIPGLSLKSAIFVFLSDIPRGQSVPHRQPTNSYRQQLCSSKANIPLYLVYTVSKGIV